MICECCGKDLEPDEKVGRFHEAIMDSRGLYLIEGEMGHIYCEKCCKPSNPSKLREDIRLILWGEKIPKIIGDITTADVTKIADWITKILEEVKARG
jgi:hypothetical protein